MVLHIIRADILLIARIFPRHFGARKNTTQLAKYLRVLYAKPSIKIYLSVREVQLLYFTYRIIIRINNILVGVELVFGEWNFESRRNNYFMMQHFQIIV